MKTVGISPRTYVPAILLALGTIAAIVAQWAVTGEFDRAELVTALTGLIGTVVQFLSAYFADPGTVVTPASLQADPADTLHG